MARGGRGRVRGGAGKATAMHGRGGGGGGRGGGGGGGRFQQAARQVIPPQRAFIPAPQPAAQKGEHSDCEYLLSACFAPSVCIATRPPFSVLPVVCHRKHPPRDDHPSNTHVQSLDMPCVGVRRECLLNTHTSLQRPACVDVSAEDTQLSLSFACS